MRVYFDASVLVSLLTDDPLTDRAELIDFGAMTLVLSDFAAAEFASVMARRLRTRQVARAEVEDAFRNLDAWQREAELVETTSADVRAAETLIRRLDLPLRTPDALNIALARRSGAALATFDRQMADAARQLGLDLLG